MKTTALPTQAQIKELLHYDPETGIFRWRYSPSNNVKPWGVAGCKCPDGYIKIQVGGSGLRAHRLAWVYMTGEQPDHDVDHKDRVRSNNVWTNLRAATDKQNNENKSIYKNNTSGFRGVYFVKKSKKWMACVMHNKKLIYAGVFDTAEQAGQSAANKRAELFTHETD